MHAVDPIPSLPEIGHPESYYSRRVRQADLTHDTHSHEAHKVGQYVTLALDPTLSWEQKQRYFQHALHRHCVAPRFPDDAVWLFYRSLADLVRGHAGREALRIALDADADYDHRVRQGEARERVEEDAEIFFRKLLPQDPCPDYFQAEDYGQLKMIRDQWI